MDDETNILEVETEQISTGKFGIRLETRLKNAALANAREKLGLTGKDAAAAIGIGYDTYLQIERMLRYPSLDAQERIIDFYNSKGSYFLPEDVFPQELKTAKFSKRYTHEAEIPRELLIPLSQEHRDLLTYEMKTDLEEGELKEQIGLVLDTLTAREAEVIKDHFGLDGREELTLKEIGGRYALSQERVRQIKEKAIKRLRCDSRSKILQDFLD